MAKTPSKQLLVCVDDEGYPAALEKRKIYVALPTARPRNAVSFGSWTNPGTIIFIQVIFSSNCVAPIRQKGGACRGMIA